MDNKELCATPRALRDSSCEFALLLLASLCLCHALTGVAIGHPSAEYRGLGSAGCNTQGLRHSIVPACSLFCAAIWYGFKIPQNSAKVYRALNQRQPGSEMGLILGSGLFRIGTMVLAPLWERLGIYLRSSSDCRDS